MVAKKLGRGLESLIQRAEPQTPAPPELEIRQIPPRMITVNRAQPRDRFDDEALDELARSIAEDGILQPLVVRRDEDGGLELIAGERRLRSALRLGLDEVPVVVRDLESDRLLQVALVENIQRQDLGPMELARAYRTLLERNGWTQAQLAEKLGKSRPGIANTLRLLDLQEPTQAALEAGELTLGHAKVLLSAGERELEALGLVRTRKLTVRELEDFLAPPLRPSDDSPAPAAATPRRGRRGVRVKPPHVADQERVLGAGLGTKVEIREGRGRGRIIIEYYSTDDFERIRDQILAGRPGRRGDD